ncbi:hypothetical protein FisN_3Lh228 [Fistulifera solaris]|uniref:Uncharacterized protein n=1 Tax=Fistulifera solaris TaxID=1519565 RepID=A0A1Z5JP26_FISSO|nr:hypothetical protein FisN_3Lh228 [Fistulifera solaris]|eukprot:GAX15785.1 hypothetical protein FisN_3Lh228 [Fistulifera solaris]
MIRMLQPIMNETLQQCRQSSPTRTPDNDRILAGLCDAARNNDASSVAKSLGLRRRSSPSVHSPLLLQDQTVILHVENLIFTDSFHLIFKALLMAPTAYDTPWHAALRVVSNLQKSNHQPGIPELIQMAALEIQTFLQQNVAFWLNEDRKQSLSTNSSPRQPSASDESISTPGDWMIQLANCVMMPLRNQGDQSQKNASSAESDWEPALGIVSCLVVLTEHLDLRLHHALLDVVAKPIDANCLMPFVRLVVDIRCFFREQDWRFLFAQLQGSLADPFSNNALPFLMECVLKLNTELLYKFDISFASLWRVIVFQIMMLASGNASTFGSVERTISTYVSSLSGVTQCQLISALRKGDHPEEDKHPRWLEACMLLQLTDATSRSKSELVSHMLKRSFPQSSRIKSRRDSNLGSNLLEDIFALTDCGASLDLVENDWLSLFRDLKYEGKGQFVGENSPQSALVNACGSLVWETICLGGSSFGNCAETRRIEAWINCCVQVLGDSNSSHRRLFTALAALTTIFYGCEESTTERAVLYCLLLSKLSQSDPINHLKAMQGVESIVSTPMTFNLFMDVVDAIVDRPYGREKLLFVSRSYLDGLSSDDAYASFQANVSASNLLKCGLHGLLALISVPDWNDLEEDAWGILSNFIVENQPRYTATHRTWFYEHVRRHIQSHSLPSLSAEHLLRSSIARLLVFYVSPDDKTLYLAPERVFYFNKVNTDEVNMVEDVISLVGLAMDLLHFLAVEMKHVEVRDTIGIVYQGLIREIDLKGADMSPSNICSSVLSAVKLGQASIYAVALVCLIAIDLEMPHAIPSPLDRMSCISVQDLMTLNADEERSKLKNLNIKWDEYTTHSNTNIAPEMKHAAITLRMQVTDVLLDFVFGPRWKETRVSYQSEILVQRLSAILTLKRQWKVEVPRKQLKTSATHSEVGICTCDHLLSVMLPSIDEIIQFDCSLGKIDSVLSVVLDICELLKGAIGAVSDKKLHLLCLESIRSLYLILCAESKCCELIVRIEKILSTKTTMDEHRQQLFCLNSVKHEDDIDDFVRYLRCSILGVIISVFEPSLNEHIYTSAVVSPHHKLRLLETIYSLLDAFCNDMLSGLQGKSGGLTYELFELLLNAAETAVYQLQSLEQSYSIMATKSSTRAIDLSGAMSALEEILQTTSFSQRNVHKKMFSLAAETLPRFYRSISRFYICCKPVVLMAGPLLKHKLLNGAAAFIQAIGFQLDTLQVHSLWKDDFFVDMEDDCSTCSGKPRDYCSKSGRENVDTASPSTKTIPAECPAASRELVVQIFDSKSWTWTMSSSLHAILVFMEDFRASLDMKTRVHKGPSIRQFIRARTVEMNGIFVALNCVLDLSDTGPKASGDTHTIKAMVLPSNLKMKICCVLDCVASTSMKSLKLIQDLARDVLNENTQAMSLAVTEALSFIVSWLSYSRSETLDIYHKARRWRHLETLHCNEDARQNGLASDNSVTLRLRKTEMRMDESEGMLHKVLAFMQNCKEKRSCNRDEFQLFLMEYIDCDLVELLEHKSTQLTQGHAVIEHQFGPAECEEIKKKRKITENMKRRLNKERRRRTLRSRNEVVDKWLQIDRVTGDEMVEDDAFADLEDFLVDG